MRFSIVAAFAAAAIAAFGYWFALDGSTPANPGYAFPIAEMRALIDADQRAKPATVAVEIVSARTAPKFATHAGLDFSRVPMAMTSFAVVGPETIVVIESAIAPRAAGEETEGFDREAYNRMSDAIAASDVVMVTHEHFDHIEGIALHPDPDATAPRLKLTAPQIAALPAYAEGGVAPDAYRRLTPADYSKPTLVAPGVAVAPAPGHTPGSQVILVRKADGTEILFVGDIVWALSNVENAWGRPRLMQTFFFSTPEDRALVQRQVRALHDLSIEEPALYILPTHDFAAIDAMAEKGVLAIGFPADNGH